MRAIVPARCARSTAALSRSPICRGRTASAIEYLRGRRSVEERAEQLDRRRIRPVDVVEHEHHRLGLRERLEQHADGAVAAVALVLDRRPAPGREAGQ